MTPLHSIWHILASISIPHHRVRRLGWLDGDQVQGAGWDGSSKVEYLSLLNIEA